MVAKKQIFEADDVWPFGKYKGQTLKYILARDPSYLMWMREQNDTPELAEGIHLLLNELIADNKAWMKRFKFMAPEGVFKAVPERIAKAAEARVAAEEEVRVQTFGRCWGMF